MTRIQYRDAGPADETFVNELTRVTMRDHVEATWDNEEERERYYEINAFRQKGTRIIQYDGFDVGRVTVTRTGGRIFLDEIHILPEYQGRGIGQQVIRNLLAEATSQDLAVELILLRSNPARSLYEGLGFKMYKEDGERYYMRKTD